MSVCRSCGAEVLWVHTEAGKSMPLDVAPVADGNVRMTGVMSRNEAGVTRPEVRVDAQDSLFPLEGPAYLSHFATCPQADEWRTT